MRLQDYISDQKIRQNALADRVGISTAFMSQICNGIRRPGADIALKIEEVTGGKVTVLELLYPDREAA